MRSVGAFEDDLDDQHEDVEEKEMNGAADRAGIIRAGIDLNQNDRISSIQYQCNSDSSS